MSLLSRRRCMLHEEKQWDYEWYPVNEKNQFLVHTIPVKAGEKVIINYFKLPYLVTEGEKISENGGYVFDGRRVGLGYCNDMWNGNVPAVLNKDTTIEINIVSDGTLFFCGCVRAGDTDGNFPRFFSDSFFGKYMKVKIER